MFIELTDQATQKKVSVSTKAIMLIEPVDSADATKGTHLVIGRTLGRIVIEPYDKVMAELGKTVP